MARLRLAPSILTADFARLGDELNAVAPYIDWVHLDVMDGHYVPNITFGPSLVAALDRTCEIPLHVHLMISEPARFAAEFARAGADRISFHPEVTGEPREVIEIIRETGCGAGIAVHPDVELDDAERHLEELEVVLMMTVRPGFGGQKFIPEVLPKIRRAREMVEKAGASADIEVDGGVNMATVDETVAAGGEILVAGSAIFDGVDAVAAARRLRKRLDELAGIDDK